MMMYLLKRGIPTVVSLFAVTSVAAAADLGRVSKAPPPAPVVVNDWTGFYIGGHAGWGWGHDSFGETFPAFPALTISAPNSDGFLGGFQAGYNKQWGNWVGGLEVDLSGTDIKGSTSNSATSAFVFILPDSGRPFSVNFTRSATMHDNFDLLGTARARVGFLFWPNVLIYGTGGLAWTRFEQSITETQSSNNLSFSSSQIVASTSSWQFGWTVGGGVEARLLNSNWFGRVEYLHYDFGNSGNFSVSTPSLTPITFSSGNVTVDVVRGGLSYKFGGPY